jgi:hypothetical protein
MRAKVRRAERAREELKADLDRRAAMFWMLHEAGASYGAIARGAGLSPGRVRQVCQDYAYQLHRRSEYVTGREPFMDRLRRAGALLGAAERDRGRILEPRFASSLAPPAAQGPRVDHLPLGRVRGPDARARSPRSARRASSTRRSAP